MRSQEPRDAPRGCYRIGTTNALEILRRVCPLPNAQQLWPLVQTAKARAEPLPPEAGALSDKRCQHDLGVCNALCKFCLCARTIQLNKQDVIVERHVIGAVLQYFVPQLGKVSLHGALPIFNRNVEAYESTECARSNAKPAGASSLPKGIIEKERPSLLVRFLRQRLVQSHLVDHVG